MRWFLSVDFLIWLSCIVVGALIKVFLLDDSRLSFILTGMLVVVAYFIISSKVKSKKTSKPTSENLPPKNHSHQ